jgi:hypothetical protein
MIGKINPISFKVKLGDGHEFVRFQWMIDGFKFYAR